MTNMVRVNDHKDQADGISFNPQYGNILFLNGAPANSEMGTKENMGQVDTHLQNNELNANQPEEMN